MKFKLLYLLAFIAISVISYSQEVSNIVWWNPEQNEFDVIDNQGWNDELESPYDRLPGKAKNTVREAVWNLSKHSAGLKIRFRSNSPVIKVRYEVAGNNAMPHMPATGVSGVDLYAKNSDGKWIWCRGRYSFGDTISYDFSDITPNDSYHKKGREYHLYLPLYNSVEWLEIGVRKGTLLEPIPIRKEKPIVVYGTSIAQGGCASRPGMAWTSILERKLDHPLINLAFSGNGRLEKEVIDLIAEINAKIYILDCLPNLSLGKLYTADEVYKKILAAVKDLRSNSSVPILLVEHAGYANASSNHELRKRTNKLNETMQRAFANLKTEGFKDIYLLQQDKLGLGLESFVDGVHPTDLGMYQYARAYEKKLRTIFKEPAGNYSTTQPVTQSREPENYNWEERHNQILELNKNNPPKICFFGNSITHFWGGKPKGPKSNGSKSWEKYIEDLDVSNFGYGWDRIENVLWRIYHGELDGFNAEQIVMMLGTNNLLLNSDKEILEGLKLVIQGFKSRQPHARILVLGIYPRRENEERVSEINLKIAQLAGDQNVDYFNAGVVLLNEDRKIDESLFLDGLHPNENGYFKLAPEIRSQLIKK
jgi:lysophospholipase L1-like esterase